MFRALICFLMFSVSIYSWGSHRLNNEKKVANQEQHSSCCSKNCKKCAEEQEKKEKRKKRKKYTALSGEFIKTCFNIF